MITKWFTLTPPIIYLKLDAISRGARSKWLWNDASEPLSECGRLIKILFGVIFQLVFTRLNSDGGCHSTRIRRRRNQNFRLFYQKTDSEISNLKTIKCLRLKSSVMNGNLFICSFCNWNLWRVTQYCCLHYPSTHLTMFWQPLVIYLKCAISRGPKTKRPCNDALLPLMVSYSNFIQSDFSPDVYQIKF